MDTQTFIKHGSGSERRRTSEKGYIVLATCHSGRSIVQLVPKPAPKHRANAFFLACEISLNYSSMASTSVTASLADE